MEGWGRGERKDREKHKINKRMNGMQRKRREADLGGNYESKSAINETYIFMIII